MGAVRTAGRGRDEEEGPEDDWTVTVGLDAIADVDGGSIDYNLTCVDSVY